MTVIDPDAPDPCRSLHEVQGSDDEPLIVPAWRTSTVLALAEQIQEHEAFDQLPILADALEDAGCDSPLVLDHCRSGVYHRIDCWVPVAVLWDTRPTPEPEPEPEWDHVGGWSTPVGRQIARGDVWYWRGLLGTVGATILYIILHNLARRRF